VKLYPTSQRWETVVQEVKLYPSSPRSELAAGKVKLYPVSLRGETIIRKVKRNSIRFPYVRKPSSESEPEPNRQPVASRSRPSTHLTRCRSRAPKTVRQCRSARHEALVNLRYNPIKTDRPTLVRPA
jgi:hypothetical protein